jgi:hypothetical protein
MATEEEILEIIKLSRGENSKTPKKLELVIGKITEQEAAIIKNTKGLNVSGFSRTIDNSGINHCFSHHGSIRELLRGQIPVIESDFLLIGKITKPENIISITKNKQGLDVIIYEYIKGDIFNYIEEVRTKRKKLALQSMYKRKPPKKKGGSFT